MLGALHRNRPVCLKRRTNRIGTHAGLAPTHAGAQGDEVRALKKIGVSDRTQDRSRMIGKQYGRRGAGELSVESFHDGSRERYQPLILVQTVVEFAGCGHVTIEGLIRPQAMLATASPRGDKRFWQ
jgi:hypothetical protein